MFHARAEAFALKFPNGYAIDVAWSKDHLCDTYKDDRARNAEVVVFHHGRLVMLDPDANMHALGHVNTEQVAMLIAACADGTIRTVALKLKKERLI
jgi:hypothetical protein